MGEREMSIITGNSSKLVAEGDTVKGLYDEGTAGITKNLAEVFKDIGDVKQTLTDFYDSMTVGEVGKRMDRVAKKATRIVRVTKADVRKWKSLVDELLDGYHEAGEKIESSLRELSDRGGETAAKASEALDRVRNLMDRIDVSKNAALAVVSKFDESDGTVSQFRDETSRLNKDLDNLKKDFEAMLSGVKKDGLKLNVDIF